MKTNQWECPRELVDLLSQLVACPSVNPGGSPPSGPPFGEGQMAELLRGILAGWGADVAVDEVSPGRYNVVARIAGRDPARSLMFEAHSDTVQVGDMTIPPFEPAVKEGKLYGRGSCDTKGGMAAMLAAIRTVLDEEGQPPADLFFVSTCNEEAGGTGAHALTKGGFRPDAAVVAEPTDLAIVNAHKGIVRWRIVTHGVAAHSSMPGSGVNAISMMQKAIERIDGPVTEALRHRHHPLLGEPAICVGTIRGGTQVNIVPSSCAIEVDRRLLPSETREGAAEEVIRELAALKENEEGFDYTFEESAWYPPLEEDPEGPIARCVARACEKVLGKSTFTVAPWGANTGIFKEAGIPCVLFGPGSIRQAHTSDEYVELEQVAKAAQVYAEIIRTA